MEKGPPPNPSCPTCKSPAEFLRPINLQVEFWMCETKHIFVADKKPPPKVSASATAASAAAAAVASASASPIAPAPAAPAAATPIADPGEGKPTT